MNAMHTSGFSLFLSSNAGMLQTLPLKINFVLEVRKLSRFGVRNCLAMITICLNSMVTSMGIIVISHIHIFSLNPQILGNFNSVVSNTPKFLLLYSLRDMSLL